MKLKNLLIPAILTGLYIQPVSAQLQMSPELLWQLGRVSGETLSADGKTVFYGVSSYDIAANKSERNLFAVPLGGGAAKQITRTAGGESILRTAADGKITYLHKGQIWEMAADGSNARQLTNYAGGLSNVRISPDGKHILFSQEVAVVKNTGADRHPQLKLSNAYVYDDLNYRHWDTWEDGKFQHVFYATYAAGKIGTPVDLMKDEPYDTPQMPFGGIEDMIWSPDSKAILYVCKKKYGKDYAQSTNTDIYWYDLASKSTQNITEGMMGYDTQPSFSKDGLTLYWLSMKEDGYEADKNDLIRMDVSSGKKINLTAGWDESVASYTLAADGMQVFFLAAMKGTEQLFAYDFRPRLPLPSPQAIRQITSGQFDVNGIVGQSGTSLVVSRADMNHAAELYRVDLGNGTMQALTTVNKVVYDRLPMSDVKARITKTTDGKDLFSWIVYPPNFDPNKKYPTLLYCQGGPQSALTQFYSFRWNLQLIAANGYIVVAPNRRGMPGHGVEWNRQISGDWGGQVMDDYLAAIDDMAKEPYVDKARLGAVGASYGGYSVFMLAGIHNKRFKTFISHDGLFDLRSWYGTTEELFFANKDIGGNYWNNPPKSYSKFNPIEHVGKWDTPIMIVQGGKDYRVGIEQGLEAFQAAQLKGIKSRLLYLPEENHWVLSAQNALVWQKEFFRWLSETL